MNKKKYSKIFIIYIEFCSVKILTNNFNTLKKIKWKGRIELV